MTIFRYRINDCKKFDGIISVESHGIDRKTEKVSKLGIVCFILRLELLSILTLFQNSLRFKTKQNKD